MRVEHIPAVSAIEKLSFPQPWPQNAYRREIVENRMAHYVIMRGRGVGELLLVALIHRGIEVGARWMTLEVRASNSVAQNLYRKYTFKEMGVRRRYYSDNGEDALVMWTDVLDSESFQAALDQNERKLAERLGGAEVRLGGKVWSLDDG